MVKERGNLQCYCYTLDVNKDKNTGTLELGYCYVTVQKRMKNYLSCCLFSVNERARERERESVYERERESVRERERESIRQ